mgnify:CR=1 FL=1
MKIQTNTPNMETGSIPRLLAQLAIPAVVAQIINLLYNIVDRIYIGHIPGDGDLALTGSTVVIDHGCGVRSYLYGLQELSVTRGQTVERGQAVGVLGEELTMDFKLGSKSVNPWPLFQTSGGLFWQEKG